MRKLLYVPIIHTESELGSVASAIESRSAALVGEEKWARHKEVVAKFWENLAHHFDSLDAANLKIYQDGLLADGELGRRVVEEAAKRGSRNHQIILNLVEKGAELMKTEDTDLIKEEYKHIIQLAQSKSVVGKSVAFTKYKLRKGSLLKERDKFVAETIDQTLKEEETGVLFMGSHHDVLPYLPEDIVVEQVKDRERINLYFKYLISRISRRRFEQLAEYVASLTQT